VITNSKTISPSFIPSNHCWNKRLFVMMEIYIFAIERAADTWAAIRQIPDYNLVVGRALFQK